MMLCHVSALKILWCLVKFMSLMLSHGNLNVPQTKIIIFVQTGTVCNRTFLYPMFMSYMYFYYSILLFPCELTVVSMWASYYLWNEILKVCSLLSLCTLVSSFTCPITDSRYWRQIRRSFNNDAYKTPFLNCYCSSIIVPF